MTAAGGFTLRIGGFGISRRSTRTLSILASGQHLSRFSGSRIARSLAVNAETFNQLKQLRDELQPTTREVRRENYKGRVIDQTEKCYREYTPPQIAAVKKGK